jgi:hypothetical protein
MDVNLLTNKLPRKSLTLIAACLGGLIIFIFVGVVPLHFSIANIDKQIKRTGYKIEEQRDFTPIYQAFQDRIRKGEIRAGLKLAIPKPAKLPREQVQNISRIMREISVQAGMTTISVNPQFNTTDISHAVSVNHVLQGSYLSFRKYLLYLAQLPYYENIDFLKIEETASGMEFTVKLKVNVA